MNQRTYRVKDMFGTLQGEGFHAGRFAVFVRFAGCNLWTGREQDRDSSAARSGATCPKFCDTDFVGGEALTAHQITQFIDETTRHLSHHAARIADPLVVFTGGEPLLQLDDELLDVIGRSITRPLLFAVETNGTIVADFANRVWITCSPKLPPAQLRLTHGDEIKIVVPSYNPALYLEFAQRFTHRYVSPEALAHPGGPTFTRAGCEQAVRWVTNNPDWRATLQTHKVLQIP